MGAILVATSAAQRPAGPSPPVSSVRILFGLTDTEPANWNGALTLESGTVKAIQGWRFGPEDSTDYVHSWKAATRVQGNGPDNVLENGVLVTAETTLEARWSVHTPRGDFSFTLRDVPWGDRKTFLDGAVTIDRVPPTAQLTTSDDDEDYPAIARSGDDIWISYVRFGHGGRNGGARLEDLARPAGGDQVFAMRYSPRTGLWDRPVPVSPPGGNVARTAVAIDGQNRVWVVWSAERDGNYHLYARAGTAGVWGPEVRVTSNPGTDLNPVAASDSKGRVWVAWQGFRGDNLEVLAAVQQGDGFPAESIVSFSPASDWDPAIAASPSGEVAIAWDTWDKGDYDVYFRRLRFEGEPAAKIEMDPPIAVAATPNFEARATLAYDSRNRLWVAYEIAPPRWGKNFGAFDTTGTALYEDHDIRIRCFDGDAVFTTSGDLINALPGAPAALRRARGTRPGRNLLQPNPLMARNRRPNAAIPPRNAPLNSSPRLATDPAGGVYLAFRSLDGPFNSRSPAGSVWFEHVVYFDGHNWAGPVFLPRTDGLLDSRPAMLALEPGHLLTVSAMDHRQSIPLGLGPGAADRINADLYSSDLWLDGLPPPSPRPELMTLQRETPAPPDAHAKEERSQVELVRAYRIQSPTGEPLRILRGDFHRHTEYSVDGTRDGSLADAYRYMIDAAALDWGGCCDTDNGGAHEYFWWTEQKMTDEYLLPGRFIPMFSFEHQARYPEGHRNILLAKRGVRPVNHLGTVAADAPPASAPDTRLLYDYLHLYNGISAPHASATEIGTDWRDNDPAVEPVVGIYEGQRQSYERAGTPRAAGPVDAINGWKPLGTIEAALEKGYRFGFVASSDHHSTHMAYTNVLAPVSSASSPREAILDAIKKRHVYASTDHIVADVRSGGHLMGDEFTVNGTPEISVRLIGSAPFAKVTIVKDGHELYTAEPKSKEVDFKWRDDASRPGKTSYYYVRGEQTDGQLVWVSPMWIAVKP